MALKCIRKLVLVTLLLLSSAFYCYSQEPSQQPQPSTQENLTKLEDFVINFENESLTQKILIEDLQRQLNEANQSVETLNAQLTEISQLQEQQSKLLKKSEFKCKVLKWSLVISIPTAIIVTGIVYSACNK